MSDWIEAKVIEILAKSSGRPVESISLSDPLDLSWDSLDLVEIVMTFEDEFKIDGPELQPGELRTVGDLVEYVRRSLGA
jgi:acyl carrier protein